MSRVLFLHGASSSGKSTLIQQVGVQSPTPLMHLSIDHLRDSGALDVGSYAAKGVRWRDHRAAFFDGFHRAVGAFADAGNNLIVEHILDTDCWHADLQQILRDHAVFFVALHTPLSVLQTREAARGDRPKGSAEADYHNIHNGLDYDLTLDGQRDAAANAGILLEKWEGFQPPGAFFR
ncbi:hypothetical protein ACMU_01060 [Actibacterium mucosum KCTC 23349]|uniref:Chloramphenicol phosphotransferase n=1 Tax=Actibacterium mucosum KCTC 23349 TaxID=1454373 RepID=A0A037ZN84_9RHOB|nr:AAA family ATPase [Actibacterium mucosum]KAJ57110.1 hypothetical protein ACMU_01060 [Actibacterium mucosum KCTC 23349]